VVGVAGVLLPVLGEDGVGVVIVNSFIDLSLPFNNFPFLTAEIIVVLLAEGEAERPLLTEEEEEGGEVDKKATEEP